MCMYRKIKDLIESITAHAGDFSNQLHKGCIA